MSDARRKSFPWRWIGLALAGVAFVFVSRQVPLNQGLQVFNQWISSLGPAGVLVYALVYAVAAVLFFPGSVLTLGAGFVFGLFWGTVAVSLGSTLGAALAFLMARYVARKRISAWAKRHEKFEAIDQAVGREGWKIVALLRLSPLIPFSISNYLYGLTAVAFWPYVLASWVAMLPGTLLYVYFGVAGKAGWEAAAGHAPAHHPLQTAFLVVGLMATAVVTWFISRVARKALSRTKLQTKTTTG